MITKLGISSNEVLQFDSLTGQHKWIDYQLSNPFEDTKKELNSVKRLLAKEYLNKHLINDLTNIILKYYSTIVK